MDTPGRGIPMAACIVASGRDMGPLMGAERSNLPLCDRCMREGIPMPARLEASGRDAGSTIAAGGITHTAVLT